MSIYRINFLPKLKPSSYFKRLKTWLINYKDLLIVSSITFLIVGTLIGFAFAIAASNEKDANNWQNGQCYLTYDHEYLLHGISKNTGSQKALGGFSSVDEAVEAAKDLKCQSIKKMIGGYELLESEK